LQLFDISLTLENALLDKASSLVAQTHFTSFGTVPTLVDLVYRIEDSSGKEVYTDSEEVTVETENIVTKKFKNLNLSDGKYTLILTTTYGDNVQDEFRQDFEVRESVSDSEVKAWVWIASGVPITGIVGLIIFLLFRKRKEEEEE